MLRVPRDLGFPKVGVLLGGSRVWGSGFRV